jgi:hypothetical protein
MMCSISWSNPVTATPTYDSVAFIDDPLVCYRTNSLAQCEDPPGGPAGPDRRGSVINVASFSNAHTLAVNPIYLQAKPTQLDECKKA